MEKIYIYYEYDLENGILTEIPEIMEIEKGNISREISDKIKSYIQESIKERAKNTIGEDTIEAFNEGSTSVCFRSVRNGTARYIYKEFRPHGAYNYIEPVISRDEDKRGQFFWLADTATDEQRKQFLIRFVRFVNQSKIISQIQHDSEEKGFNPLINPTLLLTSKGLVWRMEHLYGNTLLEEFAQDTAERSREWILSRMEMMLKVAENIETFFHKDEQNSEKIFHGDIKPENFLKIKLDRPDEYIIRNIDFDTCTSMEQMQFGYLDRFLATTKVFYDQKNINDLLEKGGEIQFWQWARLDIRALAKMLMLSLSFDSNQFYAEIQARLSTAQSCDWYRIFQETEFRALFDAIGARDSLAALYVADELKLFLLRCSDCGKLRFEIKTIKDYIAGLKKIINLMRFLMGGEYEMTAEVIRCAGLRSHVLRVEDYEEFTTEDRVDKILKRFFVS